MAIWLALAADLLYQHLLFTAEKKFWRRAESRERVAHVTRVTRRK